MQFFKLFGRKKITHLTETPEVGGVGRDYFFRMMSPNAAKLAKPYDNEETAALKRTIDSTTDIQDRDFVVVGAGPMWYLHLALKKTKSYIAIEPLGRMFVNYQFRYLMHQFPNIKLIEKKFEDVSIDDLYPNVKLFAFIFNILAYIEHPIQNINKLIKPGDIIFISSWQQNAKAREVRSKYFNYLNTCEQHVIIDPDKTIGLCHLDNFPFDKLKYYKSHKRLKGEIVDILIIYT